MITNHDYEQISISHRYLENYFPPISMLYDLLRELISSVCLLMLSLFHTNAPSNIKIF